MNLAHAQIFERFTKYPVSVSLDISCELCKRRQKLQRGEEDEKEEEEKEEEEEEKQEER
jgi:ribosomal protein L12E/L44/L45/RPP1/RPP2